MDAQRDVGRIEGQRRAIIAKNSAANAALAEARARERELGDKFASDVRAELGTVEVDLRRADELMTEATEQKGRTEIRSPIDGTIKNLRYNTIGGVVRPGEPIMEIVPARDRLVVEARLDPRIVAMCVRDRVPSSSSARMISCAMAGWKAVWCV